MFKPFFFLALLGLFACGEASEETPTVQNQTTDTNEPLAPSAVPLEANEPGYDLRFEVKGAENAEVYLCNFYGKNLFYKDTAVADAQGAFSFKGDRWLEGGTYAVVFPGTKYFELIVASDQHFSIRTTLNDFAGQIQIEGSEDNRLFYEYIQYIGKMQAKAQNLAAQQRGQTGAAAAALQEQITAVDQEVRQKQIEIIKEGDGLLVAKVILMSMNIVLPEPPKDANGNITDSTFTYYYRRAHFFDNIDFSEDRLVRNGILHNKLDFFFDKMVPQHPDSIIKLADETINRTRAGSEFFRYIVNYLTYKYETSKLMCYDKVFVHLAGKHYVTGQAFWLDSAQLNKVAERHTALRYAQCYERTPALNLQAAFTGKPIALYDVNAEYTILYFWDPECGHCKTEVPELKAWYDQQDQNRIKVYAVGTPLENEAWEAFIKREKLDAFINVSDSPEQPAAFRSYFDIFSTPKVFILNQNKEIIAKGISNQQIAELMERQLAS